MARRALLTDDERQRLLGVPNEPDALARLFTLTRSDRDLIDGRCGAPNRLGLAVQLALLRHPGSVLAHMVSPWTCSWPGWHDSCGCHSLHSLHTAEDHRR